MSIELANDGQRYSAQITDYFHQKNYVVYVLTIVDQCFNEQYKLCFRYKSLKALHEKLIKQEKIKTAVPEFPKTRSFLFVNRTNRNSKNIQDRARELEYYIFKLLNSNVLINKPEIKHILTRAKQSVPTKNRTKSEAKQQLRTVKRSSSLEKNLWKSEKNIPKLYQIEYL